MALSACKKDPVSEIDIFWTENNSPQRIGILVINNLLARPEFMMYNADFWTGIHYAEACAGFGATRLAGLLDEVEILGRLSDRYRKVMENNLVKNADHVDANVYGILPLELFLQTEDKEFLYQGKKLADNQWENPLPNGLTHQTRYWIDDIFMISSLQVQAYRATGNMVYLERAAHEIADYLPKLQQSNGLFYHGEDAPFFWGRGNGWVAAGLAELLTVLPKTNPDYALILAAYKKMMNALVKYQAEDGMWRQLIDKEDSWKETSSTAMFGYALTVGARKGILSAPEYQTAYKKAWNALTGYIGTDGQLTEVCAGTGKSDDMTFYLNRPRIRGDLHGQAPVLWFAYSLLANY